MESSGVYSINFGDEILTNGVLSGQFSYANNNKALGAKVISLQEPYVSAVFSEAGTQTENSSRLPNWLSGVHPNSGVTIPQTQHCGEQMETRIQLLREHSTAVTSNNNVYGNTQHCKYPEIKKYLETFQPQLKVLSPVITGTTQSNLLLTDLNHFSDTSRDLRSTQANSLMSDNFDNADVTNSIYNLPHNVEGNITNLGTSCLVTDADSDISAELVGAADVRSEHSMHLNKNEESFTILNVSSSDSEDEMLTVHFGNPVVTEATFTCNECCRSFQTAQKLKRHVKYSKKCYPDHPPTTFPDHMLVCTNEKPYKCGLCGYSAQELQMKAHLESHIDRKENLHRCKLCPYTSNRKWAVMRHCMAMHFICQLCSFCTVKSTEFSRHCRDKHGLNVKPNLQLQHSSKQSPEAMKFHVHDQCQQSFKHPKKHLLKDTDNQGANWDVQSSCAQCKAMVKLHRIDQLQPKSISDVRDMEITHCHFQKAVLKLHKIDCETEQPKFNTKISKDFCEMETPLSSADQCQQSFQQVKTLKKDLLKNTDALQKAMIKIHRIDQLQPKSIHDARDMEIAHCHFQKAVLKLPKIDYVTEQPKFNTKTSKDFCEKETPLSSAGYSEGKQRNCKDQEPIICDQLDFVSEIPNRG